MSYFVEELPEGWIETSLGEISHRITKGTTPTSVGFQFTSQGIRFVKVESLSAKKVNHSVCGFISPEANEALSRSSLQENDILFSIAGTLGRVAVVGSQDVPANTNQALAIIRLISPIYPLYIAEVLSSQLIDAIIKRDGRGVGLQNLNLKQVSEFNIPLPPLNEQRRIVNTIGQLFDRSNKARAALEDVPKLSEQFRQSVLAAAFRGDLTADWREKNPDVEPASELLERIKIDRRKRWEKAELDKMKAQGKEPKDDKWKKRYSDPKLLEIDDLPDIPDTWTWVNVDQVSWQVTDGEHNQPRYESQGYPMLTAKHVRDGYVDMSVVQLIAEDSFKKARFRCAPEENDLLIVSVGATTGRAAIVNGCDPFALVRSVLLVKTLIPSQFILNWIRSRWCQLWIAKASGSTAQAHLYINDTKIMPVPLPPKKELEEIIRIVKVMFDKFDSLSILLTDNFEELNRLDRSILAKAFRGELVPQDPNDEPAAVLLDRIRAEREQTSSNKQRGKTTSKNSSKQLSIAYGRPEVNDLE